MQGAWRKATHQGAGLLLQGKDKETVHRLVVDGCPNRYACRDENKSLAKVITLDGINAPDALERSVPKEWISPSLYEDAFKYINDADKYIMRKPMVRNADGTVSHDVYYVLSQSQKTFKKISASLIDR